MDNNTGNMMKLIPIPNIESIEPSITKIEETMEYTNMITKYKIICNVGDGHTIGNSIRRSCLSNLNGYAIIGFKLKGAQHLFDAVDGIKEVVQDIVFNLKKINIKLKHGLNHTILNLNKTNNTNGSLVITAGDFESNESVLIVNKDQPIATLDLKYTIDLEVLISIGKGYVTAAQHKFNQEPKDYIIIDSIFSPVVKCTYEVQCFTGGYVNHDEVLITLVTNGTHSGDEIINKATEMLANNFRSICELQEKDNSASSLLVKEKVESQQQQNVYMSYPIATSELSVRTKNRLMDNDIVTIGDLVGTAEAQLRVMSGLGEVCITEIKQFLSDRGLCFGMNTINRGKK